MTDDVLLTLSLLLMAALVARLLASLDAGARDPRAGGASAPRSARRSSTWSTSPSSRSARS